MIPDGKRKRDDECFEDRISNLPIHLIDNILDRMLICDAARTSILSKTWKNIWETHPNILLDDQFMNQMISPVKDLKAAKLEFLRVVNSILLGHRGPVFTFSLCIYLHLSDTPYPCLWIKRLAEKGVKVLDLRNKRPIRTSNMTSYFFSCSDLTSLYLENWKLNPPHEFRGFRNLTKITLWFVVFTADMSFGTQVQIFKLFCCSGIEHLDIQLTNHGKNIKHLKIERDVIMEKRHSLDYNPYTDIKKSFNLRRLLGNVPSIKGLQLNTISLSFLDPGLTLHNHLTSTMENLKTLALTNIAFDDVYVISNALCLLRSMPILEQLEMKLMSARTMMKLDRGMNSGGNVKLTAEQYLISPDCAEVTLNQLRKVSIRNILGSRAELLFIKLLLASSPSLRRMELRHSTEVDDSRNCMSIKQESLQFPRKSPVVKIYWRS